jgi:hypothetical protein
LCRGIGDVLAGLALLAFTQPHVGHGISSLDLVGWNIMVNPKVGAHIKPTPG